MFKKGDKVKILRRDITQLLCPYGTVTHVDGFYVFVRPVWRKWEIELYSSEVELVTPTWTQEDFYRIFNSSSKSYTLRCPYCGHKKTVKR